MLSYTCKTAIKAVIYLASKADSERTSVKDIAEQIDASGHTVGKMLQILVRQGVIKSIKGPLGGFYITEKQKLKPIITVVDAIDGKQIFKECGLGLSQCSEEHPCPIHDRYKEARMTIESLFSNSTIMDLCCSVNNGVAYIID